MSSEQDQLNEGKLTPEATLRKLWRVQIEGNCEVRREIEFYNLDTIISVGYRVNSAQPSETQRGFIGKRSTLEDERLKLNKRFQKEIKRIEKRRDTGQKEGEA